jgi:hypothetical protein
VGCRVGLSGFGRKKGVGVTSEAVDLGIRAGSSSGSAGRARSDDEYPIAPVHTAKQGCDRNPNTSVICEGPGPLDIVTKCRVVDKRFGAQEAGSCVRL